MPTCVYQHPLRTISLEWETGEDDVPILIGYSESDPSTDVSGAEVVIRHTSAVKKHRYPADSDESGRRSFELAKFLPEVDVDRYSIRSILSVATSFGSKWVTLLATIKSTSDQVVTTDIESDMRAIALNGTAFFIGRRGDEWWVGAVDDDGNTLHLECIPHSEKQPVAMFVHDAIGELMGTTNLRPRRLVLFGDHVTPTLLRDIAKGLGGRVPAVERLNPFAHVRSTLDAKTASSLLKRAHLLGCVVGVMRD